MPRIRQVVADIADALDTVGLLNVQLAVRHGQVYVLEANPRSSRTVPFIAKTTGVPLAKIAAKVMAGASLSELDYEEHVPEQVSVKEVVLPFDRLPGSDPRLGPEMKSTGEVMGTAGSFGKAYQKTAVVDLPVLGYEEHFDVHDMDDFAAGELESKLRAGEIDLVVSRDRDVLEVCVEETITYFSTIQSAEAALEAVNSADQPLAVQDIADRPKTQREWGGSIR
jgi:carbamoyl-phosphate synthase large subunit